MTILKTSNRSRSARWGWAAPRRMAGVGAVLVLTVVAPACSVEETASSAGCDREYTIGSESSDRLHYQKLDTLGEIDLEGEDPRIGVVLKTLSNQYWAEVKRGAEAAGELYGVEVVVQEATDEASESEQLTVAQTMVDQGFDAYVIAPITNANLTPAINQIRRDCKPLVEVIEPGVVASTYIGADEREVGYQAAEYLAERLPDGAPVLHIEGQAGSEAGEQRTQGFTKGAEELGLNLLGSGVGNWEETEAYNATEQLLERFPDAAGIYAANDTMALGVAAAVKKQGADVIVVGTDAIPAAVDLVRSGGMGATNTPFPYYQGCKAVELALRHLTGQDVPAWADSAPTLVTSDNVDKLFNDDGLVADTGTCQPPTA